MLNIKNPKTFNLMALATAGALVLSTVSGMAGANTLREQKQINDGLAIIAAADMIRKNCDTISPRMFNAYSFARSLESKAKEAGFTRSEIDAYVKNKDDKARVEGMARAYLEAHGVQLDAPASYCAAGLYEIERNSQIGVLLKAK